MTRFIEWINEQDRRARAWLDRTMVHHLYCRCGSASPMREDPKVCNNCGGVIE